MSRDHRRDPYQYLRTYRPDLLRSVAEVGSAVTCAAAGADRLTLGARAEQRAAEIVANLLAEILEVPHAE